MAVERDQHEIKVTINGATVRHGAGEASGRSGWSRRFQRTAIVGQVFLLGVAAALTAQAIAAVVRWFRRPLAP